jgi:phosphatidylglycerophosphatase A
MSKTLIASCLGLGYLPVAPGTWGSLPPAVCYWLMCRHGAQTPVVMAVMSAMALAGSVACLAAAPAVIAATGKKDPPEVVADEFAGQAVAVLLAAGGPASPLATAAAAFAAFRVLDIIKPFPARALERLPLGWGILADDLAAGIYAGLAVRLLAVLLM